MLLLCLDYDRRESTVILLRLSLSKDADVFYGKKKNNFIIAKTRIPLLVRLCVFTDFYRGPSSHGFIDAAN